ncbi:MAG: WbuC family cupin fold metalloprotein [Rhodocyclales bacterium]|nr:WbuC family cupin fold metalloprotein [Rhodocyclales bacterium]
MICWIDTALLDEVSAEARHSLRGRKNRNFHGDDAQPGHRLLNAIEPGSYIMPHRHLDPNKGETMVVLRGTLGLVSFDDAGKVIETARVSHGVPGGNPRGSTPLGMDIPSGIWHTVFALEPGTVFLEAKAGPYLPLTAEEKAPWAPAEGDPAAPAYLTGLVRLLA